LKIKVKDKDILCLTTDVHNLFVNFMIYQASTISHQFCAMPVVNTYASRTRRQAVKQAEKYGKFFSVTRDLIEKQKDDTSAANEKNSGIELMTFNICYII